MGNYRLLLGTDGRMYRLQSIKEKMKPSIPILQSHFERLERLRQIAIEDRNIMKKLQADRLIRECTKRLNERYSFLPHKFQSN